MIRAAKKNKAAIISYAIKNRIPIVHLKQEIEGKPTFSNKNLLRRGSNILLFRFYLSMKYRIYRIVFQQLIKIHIAYVLTMTTFSKRQYRWVALLKEKQKQVLKKTNIWIEKDNIFISFARSFNNIFAYITNRKGEPVKVLSSGLLNFSGSKRVSLPAAIALAKKLFYFLKQPKFRRNFLNFLLKDPLDQFLKSAVFSIIHSNRQLYYKKQFTMGNILSLVTVAHNGLRKRKKRRI